MHTVRDQTLEVGTRLEACYTEPYYVYLGSELMNQLWYKEELAFPGPLTKFGLQYKVYKVCEPPYSTTWRLLHNLAAVFWDLTQRTTAKAKLTTFTANVADCAKCGTASSMHNVNVND